MEKNIAVFGIIVNDRRENAAKVNEILTSFGHLIVCRMGVPYEERNVSIISLIVDASNEQIEELSCKLTSIDGVKASAMITS